MPMKNAPAPHSHAEARSLRRRHGLLSPWRTALFASLLASIALGHAACKKPSASADGGAPVSGPIIALGGNDVSADGTIASQAMQQLEQRSAEPALSVTFVRTPLSDAGLQQLGKFHNLR